MILCSAMVLVLLVIIIHTMVEKIIEVFHNTPMEDMENQEVDEPLEHLFDSTSIVLITILIFSQFALHFSPIQILNTRFSLLLLDSLAIIRDIIFMLHIYYRHPHLRAYVWKNMMNTSSVQPQNGQNELELQSI